MIAYFRRDGATTLNYSERAISIAGEHRLALYAAGARVLRGWALVEHGQADGLAELRQGLQAFAKTRVKFFAGCLLNALVESCARVDNLQTALAVSQEALESIAGGDDRFWHAEALRCRGDLFLAIERHNEGEGFLHRAISVAREQGARSLELRATTSLAKHWHAQGRQTDSYTVLQPVYSWFTEGFDTADLKAAKELLDKLKESRPPVRP
jgi:predicted ATPase